MRVYIVRHGDAVTPAGGGERELTPRGHTEAQAAGQLLAEQGFDYLLYSPKVRTRQTALHIIDAVGDVGSAEDLSLLPPSTGADVAAAIDRAAVDSLVLVSHLPLVAELVGWFISGDARNYPLSGYPPAGIVALDIDIAGQGMAELAWHAFPPDFLQG
jgi:phosphohistidine phosphatase